jgi:hypothetical protein
MGSRQHVVDRGNQILDSFEPRIVDCAACGESRQIRAQLKKLADADDLVNETDLWILWRRRTEPDRREYW